MEAESIVHSACPRSLIKEDASSGGGAREVGVSMDSFDKVAGHIGFVAPVELFESLDFFFPDEHMEAPAASSALDAAVALVPGDMDCRLGHSLFESMLLTFRPSEAASHSGAGNPFACRGYAFAGTIRSNPVKGLRTSGTMTLPSSC